MKALIVGISQRLPTLLLLIPFLGIPMAAQVASLISTQAPQDALTLLAGWFYAMCVLSFLFGLVLPSTSKLWPFFQACTVRLLAFQRVVLGQSLAAWLVALTTIAVLAWPIVQHLGPAAQQHAYWVKLSVDAESQAPPPIKLHLGTDEQYSTFEWQPYPQTIVAVRNIAQSSLPIVTQINTDHGEVKLRQAIIRGGILDKDGIHMVWPEGMLLSWPRRAGAIELSFAPGYGQVELLWYDQRTRLTLSEQPSRVMLQLPSQLQGWAMLPAQEITALALEFPAEDRVYTIRQLDVFSNARQTWKPTDLGWKADGCTLETHDAGLMLTSSITSKCSLTVPNLRPLNHYDQKLMISTWLVLTLISCVTLILITLIVRFFQRRSQNMPVSVRTRINVWPFDRRAALIVFGIAFAWHVLYALAVPVAYTNDSLNYYQSSQQLMQNHSLAAYWSDRTPGYPAIIALIVALCGDTVLLIIVAQQIALALLAPLTMWALAGKIPVWLNNVIGLAVGVIPVSTLSANFLLSEAFYTVFMTAAFLVYARCGAQRRPMLVCGFLIGAAVMHRPAGLLALALLGGWLLMLGWLAKPGQGTFRRSISACIALVIGYCVLAAPWQLHLALTRHTADISAGRAAITLWANTVQQQEVHTSLAAIQPDRALWSVPHAWDRDAFLLSTYYPEAITSVSDLRRQDYFLELTREAQQAMPGRVLQAQMVALLYNLAYYKIEDTSIYYWEDFSYFMTTWQYIDQQPPPLPTSDSIGELIPMLSYRWLPQHSPVRSAFLGISRFAIEQWRWLALIGLSSPIFLLIGSLRRLLPGWLYWLSMVGVTSISGMAAQRYMVVIEPLLYILALLAIGVVIGKLSSRLQI